MIWSLWVFKAIPHKPKSSVGLRESSIAWGWEVSQGRRTLGTLQGQTFPTPDTAKLSALPSSLTVPSSHPRHPPWLVTGAQLTTAELSCIWKEARPQGSISFANCRVGVRGKKERTATLTTLTAAGQYLIFNQVPKTDFKGHLSWQFYFLRE